MNLEKTTKKKLKKSKPTVKVNKVQFFWKNKSAIKRKRIREREYMLRKKNTHCWILKKQQSIRKVDQKKKKFQKIF